VQVQAVLPGATRTEIWSAMGIDADQLPEGTVMDAAALVDAALVGFDRREVVTIPPLPDAGEFEAYTKARLAMAPNLSRSAPAARYLADGAAA
jgi:short-subunit dehydrogenase